MFKRIAILGVTLSLGFAAPALAVGPERPSPEPKDVAAAVIKHRIEQNIPDLPDFGPNKQDPNFCMSRVLEVTAESMASCESAFSVGCMYSSFETLTTGMQMCSQVGR